MKHSTRSSGSIAAAALLVLLLVTPAGAQSTSAVARVGALLSKLQGMGHGSYPAAEWGSVFDEIAAIEAAAAREEDWNSVVEARIIKAMVLGDMQHDNDAAVLLLEDTKRAYGHLRLPAMKKVYVRQAEFLSRMGDEAAVTQLIREFEGSPHYDADIYRFSGGKGREEPLRIVRPSAGAVGSVSVTAMEAAKSRSRFGEGALFPEFSLPGLDGSPVSLAALRGKVVLVDFWLPGWTSWERELPHLVSLYRRYRDDGFEIVGMCLAPGAANLEAFTKSRRMTWPMVADGSSLAKQLGIFGEAASFVVDRNGVIVARNVSGSDLVEAVRKALGP